MSDTAWAESFLSSFVLPLITGDAVHIAAPLGLRGVTRLREAVVHKLDATEIGGVLGEARRAQLHPLGFCGPAPQLIDDSAVLAGLVGLHDLLFLLHPEAVRLSLEGRAGVLRTALRLCQQAALDCDDPSLETLYGRHSLFGALWRLGRDDVRRQTRRGVEVYKGRKAPRRWLGDDDDDEVQRVYVLPELFGLPGDLGRDVMRALFAVSPLSDLYQPLREAPSPPLELLEHAGWLRLPAVARLLIRRYCEFGLPAVAPVLTGPLLASLESAPPGPAVVAWLGFVSHLHLVAHVVGDTALPAPSAAPQAIDFYALYAALYATRPALALPADVRSDPSLRQVAAHHVERCRALAGPLRVNKLSSLLGKSHVEAA